MKTISKQIAGGLIFLAISLFYGIKARGIELFFYKEGQIFTARTIPYALSILGIIFSVLYLIFPIARLLRLQMKSVPGHSGDTEGRDAASHDWKTVVMLLILMIFYVAMFSLLGFIIATIAFLMGGFFIMGIRSWKGLLIVPTAIVVIFWLLVEVLLNIHLMSGSLWM